MSKTYCFFWLAESVWIHETFSWTSAKKHIRWYAKCSGINFWGLGDKLMLRKITWNESRGTFCGLLHSPIVIVVVLSLFFLSPVFSFGRLYEILLQVNPTFIFIREALIFMQHDSFLFFYPKLKKMQLRRYEEVIQFCEQTLDSAEKNSPSEDIGSQTSNLDDSEISKKFYFRIWRCRLTLKSYFLLGKLEEGLASLEMQEARASAMIG